jgi:hypothetical protein
LFAFVTICLAGCAVSPIVDGDLSAESEVDSGFESIQSSAPEPSDDEPGVDPNATSSDAPSLGSSADAPRPSPGASPATDAGGSPRDAGVHSADVKKDAGVTDAGVTDAGVKDAGVKDAGRPDSGSSTTPTAARDAGQTTAKPASGTCRAASDCTESCVPIGIINCCRANGTCGCTWVPGTYCQ